MSSSVYVGQFYVPIHTFIMLLNGESAPEAYAVWLFAALPIL